MGSLQPSQDVHVLVLLACSARQGGAAAFYTEDRRVEDAQDMSPEPKTNTKC